MPSEIKHHIEKMISRDTVKAEDYSWFFEKTFNGDLNESSIAAFLTAFRMRGEDSDILFAGASAMRTQAVVPQIERDGVILADNCGTGGDGLSTFNISTASAINAASLGITVAKHGNRSVSSKCGSADLLFECGYPDKLSPELLSKMLKSHNFAFFFAPSFHPVMRYVMPVRKALGIRTVFNLLGPLANPLQPEIQLLGVSHKKYIHPMAIALNKLGVKRALIVHSRDGMDEISPCDKTDCIEIKDGNLSELEINPKDFKISASANDLVGGDASYNKSLFHELLSGKKNAILDAVSLNSGALHHIYTDSESIEWSVDLARENILNGNCESFFSSLITEATRLANG